jgi:thioredoxin-like negative regulator of GroEL
MLVLNPKELPIVHQYYSPSEEEVAWATEMVELAEKYDGKIIVGKCDVEENEELAAEFGIRNIPTILFFKGGAQVDKLVGAQSKAKFEEKIEALL